MVGLGRSVPHGRGFKVRVSSAGCGAPAKQRGFKFFLHLPVLLLISVLLSPAGAEEGILDFHSDITVHEDAHLTVKETIRVRGEGKKIKHGIYRDFPAKYAEGSGKIRKVGFHVVGAKRDGRPEAYSEAEQDNGVRVYLGKKDVDLPPAEYEYELTYTTDHQLGFFDGFDELYWNVTGNGWYFSIEKASAEIHLPGDAGRKIIRMAGYTGYQGSQDQNYTGEKDPSGTVRFQTTDSLSSYEGLTVAVSWPKGYVRPEGEAELVDPLTGWDRIRKEMMPRSAGESLYVFVGLALLAAYYGIVWLYAGKDPASGVIVVRYTPPSDMSPAVMRYLTRMGYDDKTFAAALINMAVKGFLSIHEEDGEYTVKKKEGGRPDLSIEERKAYDYLFSPGRELALTQSNHSYIRGAIRAISELLEKKFEKIYFVTNRRYFIAGLVLTGLLLIVSGFSAAKGKGTIPLFVFICTWLTGWSVGVAALLRQTCSGWKQVLFSRGLNRLGNIAVALFTTCFAVPFIGGEGFGMYLLATGSSFLVVLFLIASIGINYLFFHLLKAPTGAGRKVLDGIEGFRRFLAATEQDRLNMLNPADRTPQMFERYLPYALALDVEQQWAEQFSDMLSGAAAGEGQGFSPSWYSGSSWNSLAAASFASSLGGSFSNAISSSSTAPGSSSGSGGGGSSGGGGGGGGGGGW